MADMFKSKSFDDLLTFYFACFIGNLLGKKLDYFKMNKDEKRKIKRLEKNFIWPDIDLYDE